MTQYRYQCNRCRATMASSLFQGIGGQHEVPCIVCNGDMIRVASVNFIKPMKEHYNPSVGKHISTMREFRDGLKRGAEEEYLQTGMEHTYVEVDPTDKKSLGVTDEGLDDQQKRHRELGWTEPPTTKIIT